MCIETPFKLSFNAVAANRRAGFLKDNGFEVVDAKHQCAITTCEHVCTKEDAAQHFADKHPDELVNGVCPFCEKIFKSSGHFMVCKKLQAKKKSGCKACLITYKDMTGLRRHWEKDSHFRGSKVGPGQPGLRKGLKEWCGGLDRERRRGWVKEAKGGAATGQEEQEDEMVKGGVKVGKGKKRKGKAVAKGKAVVKGKVVTKGKGKAPAKMGQISKAKLHQ